jgi:hypothetical protein
MTYSRSAQGQGLELSILVCCQVEDRKLRGPDSAGTSRRQRRRRERTQIQQSTFGSSAFGTVTSSGPARQIQLGAKFEF